MRLARRIQRERARRLAKAAARVDVGAPARAEPKPAKDDRELLRVPITKRQADMLVQAQGIINRANAEIQVMTAAILAGSKGRRDLTKGGVELLRITDTKPPMLEIKVAKRGRPR